MIKKNLLLLLCLLPSVVMAQEVIALYPDTIPNAKETSLEETDTSTSVIRQVIRPTLQIYLPEKENATGEAVVICPGGGYTVLVYKKEGIRIAQEFVKNGVAAFVLKYRLPLDETMLDKKNGPLQDAQQAIKMVRENTERWDINIRKVGIMGFSAGGHLVSTAATHFDTPLIENENNTTVRPDFQILIYPVISMQDSLTHSGSRTKLLGQHPSKEIIDQFSNELQVNENTPPAFIIHAGDDKVVDVDHSIFYYEALRHHDVPAELHLFPKGGHGFVLSQPTEEWMRPLFLWMKKDQWMNN